jgi:hypothetical protein
MASELPPGPAYPSLIQAVGFWNRPLPFMERCRARYGKRFTIRLPATPPFVMISDPAEIKQVFTAAPDVLCPGEGARVLEPIVGTHSVILLDGGAHMEQRKLLLPAFHGERIERLESVVAEVAEREVASWPQGTLTLHERMQGLTMEIILRAVFGMPPGERLEAMRQRLSAMLAFGERPISLVPPLPDPFDSVLRRVGPFVGFLRIQAEVDEMIEELIAERRRDGSEGDDVLAMLLAARHSDGEPMSAAELRDELMTLLVAGHETTATSLSWAFEQISRAPQVLARLNDELEGDDDAYLVATIQEVLRRRPVLPNSAPRLVKKPIEVGGWDYPTGVSLVPHAYLVQHDPEIYPDPYSFRPERFLSRPPGTYTWIPFGGGRRRCLGASFAMLEMKVVLRAVLTTRALTPSSAAPEPARRRNITVTPRDGGRVSLPGRTAKRPAAASPVAA